MADDAVDLGHDDHRLEDRLAGIAPRRRVTSLRRCVLQPLNHAIHRYPVVNESVEQAGLTLAQIEVSERGSNTIDRLCRRVVARRV
jgi:hypothetical protein